MTLYGFGSAWEPAPRPTPPGTTLLAIGDVHGQAAHLDGMLARLGPVIAAARGRGRRCELVTIGDYIDRGPDSLGVLERLLGLQDRLGIPVHRLRGNHDQFLIGFLGPDPTPELLEVWCANGGEATLLQLGIGPDAPATADPAALATVARGRLGPALVALLEGLAASWASGAYLFVHGGVHPDRPLARHGLEDLLWLREPFLSARRWPHPFTVVHGHTVLGPQVLPHRIAIDSGCFATGVLSAVELGDDRLRFHAVASDPGLRAFRALLDPDPARRFTHPLPLPPAP